MPCKSPFCRKSQGKPKTAPGISACVLHGQYSLAVGQVPVHGNIFKPLNKQGINKNFQSLVFFATPGNAN